MFCHDFSVSTEKFIGLRPLQNPKEAVHSEQCEESQHTE